MNQHKAPIVSALEVMPRTHLIWLEAPAIAAAARPGQFVMVGSGEDCFLPRPISIHRKDGGKIALLIQTVGKGTEWLAKQRTGQTLNIFGPLGNGFMISPEAKNLLLVAGGIGIAPLVFLVQEVSKRSCKIKLLIGGKTAAQLYPENLLPDGLDIVYATEDATLGRPGRITTVIPDYFGWADQIFACGPVPMYRNMADNFPQLKGHPVQVSLEVVMGCGAGVCYGCTIRTKNGLKQVCKDGPVFELREMEWDNWGERGKAL